MAQQQKHQQKELYLSAILAWLVPGAGHCYLGQRARGGVICAAICTTFLLGLILGGVEVIDPRNSIAWFCAQILCGLPAIIGTLAQDPNLDMGYGRGVDLGQVYAGVAGLMNLFCILDLILRQPPVTATDKTKTKKA